MVENKEDKTMTLYDYLKLMPEGEELTVWDIDYDIEVYFYGGKPADTWSKAISDLSKLLTIKEIRNAGVAVNLSNIIEKKIDKLEEAIREYRKNKGDDFAVENEQKKLREEILKLFTSDNF